MAEFNFAEVRQLIAERGVGKKEAQKIWWEKLAEFLVEEKSETVSRRLLEQINKECSGFKLYVMGKYARPENLKELEQKIAVVRQKKEDLQEKNKEIIRYAKEWIYIDVEADGEKNTGILYCALEIEAEDDECLRHFKKFFRACVKYESFGYHAGTYRMPQDAYEGFRYFAPECLLCLQQVRLKDYEAYCVKARSLAQELDALENEWLRKRKDVCWLELPTKRQLRLVE